ncbi:MAG: flagellar export chaperone FliS [Verrucomicrobiota bacterium]|nr:flagellar export chaperone FliS [Verrucomicrobiota bacterium]
MITANPWKSYQKVATQTAPPGQLVLMLFEGAIRFLEQAQAGFEKEDPVEFNQIISNNILRTQDILFELNMSLNMAEGGELAATLRSLYNYMDRRLMESNVQKDISGIQDVLGRVIVLRDAWAAMLQGHTDTPPPTNQRAELAAA